MENKKENKMNDICKNCKRITDRASNIEWYCTHWGLIKKSKDTCIYFKGKK